MVKGGRRERRERSRTPLWFVVASAILPFKSLKIFLSSSLLSSSLSRSKISTFKLRFLVLYLWILSYTFYNQSVSRRRDVQSRERGGKGESTEQINKQGKKKEGHKNKVNIQLGMTLKRDWKDEQNVIVNDNRQDLWIIFIVWRVKEVTSSRSLISLSNTARPLVLDLSRSFLQSSDPTLYSILSRSI